MSIAERLHRWQPEVFCPARQPERRSPWLTDTCGSFTTAAWLCGRAVVHSAYFVARLSWCVARTLDRSLVEWRAAWYDSRYSAAVDIAREDLG